MSICNIANKSEIMYFLTPKDSYFEYQRIKKFFEENKKNLQVAYSFEHVLKNSHFFAVYENHRLVGCIYFFKESKKLFMNGFSLRKKHLQNIKALKISVGFYNCDICARTDKKTAKLCLTKAGFKQTQNGLYIYERK